MEITLATAIKAGFGFALGGSLFAITAGAVVVVLIIIAGLISD